jgi:hypothetical protein
VQLRATYLGVLIRPIAAGVELGGDMRPLGILAAICVPAVVDAAFATGSIGSGTKNVSCPVVNSDQWQLPTAPYGKGAEYQAKNDGTKYTRPPLDGYVRAVITTRSSSGESGPVSCGPKGWYCTASSGKNGHPYEGQCSPTKAASFFGTGFSWGVVLQ